MKNIEFKHLKYNKEPARFSQIDVEPFILWCVSQEASDITIQNEEQIICEIHGKMHRVTSRRLTKSELIEMVTFIYKGDAAIARLNGGSDVDTPWSIKVDRSKTTRFRVNMTPIFTDGHTGYQITIRTIKNRAPLLETLKLPTQLIENISPKQGLIVIVGATGSGKSTLLASVMDWRMRDPSAHLKILTYEAPIEYVYDDVEKPTTSIAQTEIPVHLKSFEDGVRNALRRKPSIILMGEMRDKETIGEGVTASMTGHTVYGTLHANGVSDAIRRMVNVFDAEEKNARAFDILGSLKMIIAQRLLPSTDGKRVAIREYLIFTEEIADAILEGGIENLSHTAKKMLKLHGQTFEQDATAKHNEGILGDKEYMDIIKLTKITKGDSLLDEANLPIDKKINNKSKKVDNEWEPL